MMTLPRASAHVPNQKGFSLVEVLVALLVLSIGLLGLAALQTTSLQFNTGSYHRTQATYLAYDIIDRMRVNIGAVVNSDGSGYDQPVSTDVSMSKDCDSDNCNSGELAIYDVRMWYERAVAALPGAAAVPPTIQVGAGNLVTVTINWMEQDMQKSQSWVVQL